jgi:ABC-type glycerol-3-phosphate transport system substrate-binding protein
MMSKISHQKAHRFIQAQADKLLKDDQKEILTNHLADCAACRQYQAEIESVEKAIQKSLQHSISQKQISVKAIPSNLLNRQIRRKNRIMNIRKGALVFLGALFLISIAFMAIYFGRNVFPQPMPANLQTPTINSMVSDDENVIITFAVPGFIMETYLPLAEAFERENSGISIQIVTPSEFYELWNEEDLFNLASAADTSFHLSSQELLQNQTFFLDLIPLMENDPEFDMEDFWMGSLSACRDETGKIVGLPLDLNMTGMLVDKSAFEKVNITAPAPGWRWSEFVNDLQVLGAQQNMVYLDSQTFFTSVLAAQIDPFLTDEDELSKRFMDYENAVQAGQIHAYDENQSIGERQTLLDEQSPALWSASLNQAVEVIDAQRQTDPAWGFVPYPINESTNNTSPFGSRCAMISQGSQHPREAWLWLKFLSEHWLVSADQVDRYQYIPARISVANSSGFWDGIPATVGDTVRYGLAHAWYRSEDSERFSWIHQIFNGVLAGETNLQIALAAGMRSISPSETRTPAPAIAIATPQKTLTSADDQSIKFYSDAIDQLTMQAILEEYQKTHPEISIELIHENNFMNIDLENFTRNFDCFSGLSMYVTNPSVFIEGELLPLNAFLDLEPDLGTDFLPVQLDQYTREGKLLGLPDLQTLSTLTYNIDLLKKLGIPIPTNDWSVDEFLNLINDVSAQSSDELEMFGYAMISDQLLLASKEIGIEVSIPDFQFTSETSISTANWLKSLVDDNNVVRNPADDPNRVAVLVAAGQVAIWDSAFNGWFFNGQEPDFRTGEVAIPITSTPLSVNSGGQAYYISSQASDPQACWDWISFLSSQPAASMYWPVRQSVATSEEWQSLVGAEAVELFTTMQERELVYETMSPQQQTLQKIWVEAMKAIYEGLPAKTVLSDAQNQYDDYLTCMQMNLPSDADYDQISEISEGCFKK